MKTQKENPNYRTIVVCLTANAISGAREQYIAAGFDNYLTKPINPDKLEEMLLEYLPKEIINGAEAAIQNEPPQASYEHMNIAKGLEYSTGEDMFRSVMEIFCSLHDGNKEKIKKAFESGNWKNYTIFVHALKSTSLSIGGEKCSELAKKLERAGNVLKDNNSSESDKHEAEEYIKSHHAEAMELYDKLVEEGKRYLGVKEDKTLTSNS